MEQNGKKVPLSPPYRGDAKSHSIQLEENYQEYQYPEHLQYQTPIALGHSINFHELVMTSVDVHPRRLDIVLYPLEGLPLLAYERGHLREHDAEFGYRTLSDTGLLGTGVCGALFSSLRYLLLHRRRRF